MLVPDGLEIVKFGPNVFFVAGELDMASAPALDDRMHDAVQRGGPVVVDVSAVTFMDASGYHVLRRAAERLPSGCLVLHGVTDAVERVIEVTRLAELPAIHVVPCSRDPYPALDLWTWIPDDDLGARLEALRAAYNTSLVRSKSLHRESARLLRQSAAVRAQLRDRRAAA